MSGPGRGALGRRGESLAARYLRRRGYRVLERNVRLPYGEVDLVCLAPDRRTIVFVEVKTRRMGDGDRPPPEASVTAGKRRRLVRLADGLARGRDWTERPLRIDVVAVEVGRRGWFTRARVRHHEAAVGR